MKFSNLLGFEKEVLAMPSHRSVVVDDALDTYCLLGLAGSWQLVGRWVEPSLLALPPFSEKECHIKDCAPMFPHILVTIPTVVKIF